MDSGCGRPCKPGMWPTGEVFRIGAKAGDGMVALGGWMTGPKPDKATARWCFYELWPASQPWAWQREGEPHRVIATLELLTALRRDVALRGPLRGVPRDGGGTTIGTDNKSNEGFVRNWTTTKFPRCTIAMELSLQLAKHVLDLDLHSRPRETNVEAEALSNGDRAGFKEEVRAEPGRRRRAGGLRFEDPW